MIVCIYYNGIPTTIRMSVGVVVCVLAKNVSVINPWRACAARVTVVVLCVCLSVCLFVCLSVCLFVCLSVCLFVSIYSRTTGYEAAYERYQQLQCYKGRKNNVAILLKRQRYRENKRKSQYAQPIN